MSTHTHKFPPGIEEALSKIITPPIQSVEPVGGGDISEAWTLQTNNEALFLKTNTAGHALPLFEAEARGLSILGKHIIVPRVRGVGKPKEAAFLLMDFIPSGKKKRRSFGKISGSHWRNSTGKQLRNSA